MKFIANEISVLPYYVANLSIEYTYEKLTGEIDHFKISYW